jgi:hypothetical protein
MANVMKETISGPCLTGEALERGLRPRPNPFDTVIDISYRLIDLSTCRLLSMFCVQVLGAKLSLKLDGLLYKALCIWLQSVIDVIVFFKHARKIHIKHCRKPPGELQTISIALVLGLV